MLRSVDVIEVTGPHSSTRLSSYLLRVIVTQLRWPEPTSSSMILNESQEERFRSALEVVCTHRRDLKRSSP
jgi:hypothetical protein